jgi:hypothetical protein
MITTSCILAVTNVNNLAPGQLETLSPTDISDRIYGSKIQVAQEEAMIHTIWGVKMCLVILYKRLA